MEDNRMIVRIQGGLGNQMFQYTLYLWLSRKYDTLLDISSYSNHYKGSSDAIHNGYELERVFGIKEAYAERKDVNVLANVETDFMHRVKRRLFGNKKTYIKQANIDSKDIYTPSIFNKTPAYIDGYWCTFSYAEDIEDNVRKAFHFSGDLGERNQYLLKQITSTDSISIHVRHGDYLKLQDFYYIPDVEYYINSMRYFCNRITNPVFYCFSDDIEWCKSNFLGDNIQFIDWNTGNYSYVDMQLMSMCKHNIIANSTFSMWAAWLNQNPSKIVIRPSRVYCNPEKEKTDTWPRSWITV